MADRQAQVPGGAYYNDAEEAALYQRQVPGFQYVNDTQQTAGGGGTEVSASDGLYLKDHSIKDLQPTKRDGLLTFDLRTTLQEHGQQDKMYLFDQAFAQAIRQRYALDPIYVRDDRYKTEEHVNRDGMYLRDEWQGVQEHTFREGLYLKDYSIKELLKVLRDGLLIFDQVTTSAAQQFSITVTDGLYLKDYFVREILKIVRDAMLLVDSVQTQSTSGQNLYEVTATDFILIGDSGVRQMLKGVIEFMLLGDSVQRELTRIRFQSDGVLLKELLTKAIDKYNLETVLLYDVSARVREMLLREGVYLTDSQAAVLTVVGAEFLNFARLRMVRLLGITLRAADLLGRRTGVSKWDVR